MATNADKIRQMTDEEMLVFLKKFAEINRNSYCSDTLCTTYEDIGRCEKFCENCEKCLFSWLKQEVPYD